ncbi:MAG: hypothetical protein EXR59_00345 [Dehalococcoidia bacterium]|nr:hypothetical protein [Dehalococcoidia bacterium]
MPNKKEDRNEFLYLATAPNQIIAEMWVQMLKQQNIPSYFRSSSAQSYLGSSFTPCQVMVSKSKLSEAETLIQSIQQHG